MKTEFRAKYLQHLLSKKKKNEGFTLIELLVVIIIVGVLAAIALPSFLNLIGKARGSEAKAAMGVINRSQQAFRLENNTFAGQISLLDAQITSKFYNYAVPTGGITFATSTATTAEQDLKNYSGAVSQVGDTFNQLICETLQTVANGDVSGEPGSTTFDPGDVLMSGCPGGYKYID